MRKSVIVNLVVFVLALTAMIALWPRHNVPVVNEPDAPAQAEVSAPTNIPSPQVVDGIERLPDGSVVVRQTGFSTKMVRSSSNQPAVVYPPDTASNNLPH